jgi:hypothetical protein
VLGLVALQGTVLYSTDATTVFFFLYMAQHNRNTDQNSKTIKRGKEEELRRLRETSQKTLSNWSESKEAKGVEVDKIHSFSIKP